MYNAIKLPLLLQIEAWVLVLVLFVSMLVAIALGKRLGKRRMQKGNFQENPANSTIHNSVFALLAFLLAFTFGMSATRFDARRQAVVNEANAIGTAILRADMYPDSERVMLRQYFKGYLDGKIAYIKAGAEEKEVDTAELVMAHYQKLLWHRVTAFSKTGAPIVISSQMVPALNQMFDAATTTRHNELFHVPQSIESMLFIVSVIAAFFLGYISVGKGNFDWFTGIGFCVLISVVIYITLDLDRTRRGLIKLDTAWQSILVLEDMFKHK